MRKFFAVVAVCATLFATSMDADAARRFGGGSSFGRPAPTFTQKAPSSTPSFTPSSPSQPTATPRPQQQSIPNAAPTPVQRPSMARSLLTGLATALGISALLSLLGINGSGMVSFVMGLLLVMVLYMVVRGFLARKVQAQSSTNQGVEDITPNAYRQTEAPRATPYEAPQPQPSSWTASGASPASGSVMDQFMNEGKASMDSGVTDITPTDFDKNGFLKTALENYRKLQKAWDTGNVIEISEFMTQEVFVAITHQLRARGNEVYVSEVLELNNELLGITQDGPDYLAAVRFAGKIKINNEVETISEIWTLEKKVDGSTGWLLAGIKQIGEEGN